MLYVLRDTGGRIGGLLSAKLEDLDLEAGLLTVREKGNHERDLPLNDPTCDALRQWLDARSEMMPDSDYLFIGMHGKPLSRSGVYGMLDRLREKGGICGRMNPHAFRHAFARDSLRNGADISEVSQLMGHSTPTVTLKYYARWDKGELHAVHRRVSPGAHMKVINLAASD